MNAPVLHVVDDDDSIRSALARLLGAAGFEVRCYASAGEYLLYASEAAPGCMLLDIKMPGPSGLDLHEIHSKSDNPLPVIFLTGFGDVSSCARAMKAGAVDFLTKPVDRDALLTAVKRALARDHEERAVREQQRALRERYEKLSPREREVLRQVAGGKLNKQIAFDLGTSERTVKAHRAHVMEKLGLRSIAELVRAADEVQCLLVKDPNHGSGRLPA